MEPEASVAEALVVAEARGANLASSAVEEVSERDGQRDREQDAPAGDGFSLISGWTPSIASQ